MPGSAVNDRDTEQSSHLAHISIKVDGANLVQDIMHDMLEVVVENSLFMPDSCTIRLNDSEVKHIDNTMFKLGAKIEVGMGESQSAVEKIFEGEIVGIDADLAAHAMASFVVRCLNKGHRLNRQQKRRTFLQMKVSDIANKIAGEHGLSSEVDDAGAVHEYICQNNQTDWEFLRDLADRHDLRFFFGNDQKLRMKKIDASNASASVEYGLDLRSFRPRLSGVDQVDTAVVRGWDPKQKKEIVGKATTIKGDHSVGIGSGVGGDKSKVGFGGAATEMVVSRPVHSQGEAELMAQSYLDRRGTRFIEAEGLSYGNSKIKPGVKVKVKGVGTNFGGDYNVSATVHTYTPAEGYTTQFICSGKDPHTLLSMIDGEDRDNATIGNNIVIGLVTNNKDAEGKMGRVKVKFPWLEDNVESDWCRVASPMAGNDRGFLYLPEVNDEVLVAFEHGDVRRPYIIGSLWNGKDALPEPVDQAVNGSGQVIQRMIKTRVGHIFMLDDSDDKRHIEIISKDQHSIRIDDKEKFIHVKTKDGHYVKIDDGAGTLSVVDKTGKNSIVITSGSGNIDVKCSGNFSVDAHGKVDIKGAMGVEVKGMTVKVTADTTMDLKANGMTTVESSAIMTIKGSLVKIN